MTESEFQSQALGCLLGLLKEVDDPYRIATLHIEAMEGSAGVDGDYEDYSGQKTHLKVNAANSSEFCDAILAYQEQTSADASLTKWNRGIGTLTMDNIFLLDLYWDQELQDRVDGFK